jgi:hypothetical protein
MNWKDSSQKKKHKWPINTKKNSTSLATKEIQIKTHWDPISPQSQWQLSKNQTTNASDDAGEYEPFYTVGRNIN